MIRATYRLRTESRKADYAHGTVSVSTYDQRMDDLGEAREHLAHILRQRRKNRAAYYIARNGWQDYHIATVDGSFVQNVSVVLA